MYISKDKRITELKQRIAKLSIDSMTNANLIRKAEREIRKLSSK